MTEKTLKVELSREFFEKIIKYQETQRARTSEIIKMFSGKAFDSHQFTLLCEHMVLLNGYIEILDETSLTLNEAVSADENSMKNLLKQKWKELNSTSGD